MGGRHWTKEEEEFLKANYKTVQASEIAKKLNRTDNAVQLKARRVGVTKRCTRDESIHGKVVKLGLKGRKRYTFPAGDQNPAKRPEVRAKISRKKKEYYNDPKNRRRQAELTRRAWQHPETKKNLLAGTRSTKERERRRQYAKNHNSMWKESAKRKQSRRMKLSNPMDNPIYRKKAVMNATKAAMQKPNKSEMKLFSLLQETGNNYNYTGCGKKANVIGNMVPDFTHKHKKKLIELFGEPWHKPTEEKKRIQAFNELGYDCLVIWWEELKDMEQVKRKVIDF